MEKDQSRTGAKSEAISLFDGKTLTGWRAIPRIYGATYPGGPSALERFDRLGTPRPVLPESHAAIWDVEDGQIVGQQDVPGSGYGGYLITQAAFADFELTLKARPDWPADTGVMVRRRPDSWAGFQVLLDHRDHGGIAGFFGNGLGAFSALPWAIRGRRDASGTIVGLEPDDVATSPEPVTQDKIDRLTYASDVDDFIAAWKWDDWNEMRIRVIGDLPVITTWINDLKIAEIDTAALVSPNYDAAAVLDLLGNRGHIALEVHDNDPSPDNARWGVGAKCRWKDILIQEI